MQPQHTIFKFQVLCPVMAEISPKSKSYIIPHCWIYPILELLHSLWPVNYWLVFLCLLLYQWLFNHISKKNIQKPPPHNQKVVKRQPAVCSYSCYHIFIDLLCTHTFLHYITLGISHYCNFIQLHFAVLHIPWKKAQEVTEEELISLGFISNHHHFGTSCCMYWY